MSRSDPSPQAQDDGVVLAGVKAKPFGWPPASLDAGSGRHQAAAIGGKDPPKSCLYGFRGLPNVRLQLTALGIHPRDMKRARIDQLVQELPASVVADVVGISVGTALHHAAQTNATWAVYPELRTPARDQ